MIRKSDFEILGQFQLTLNGAISQIRRTSYPSEYAFATSLGLAFATITKDSQTNKYIFT